MKKISFLMLTFILLQLTITESVIKENEGFVEEQILACKDCRD